MPRVAEIGARALLAAAAEPPRGLAEEDGGGEALAAWRDGLHVDVVLYARLTSGACIDTATDGSALGFDVGRTRSIALPDGESPDGPIDARLTEGDLLELLERVARESLDLLADELAGHRVPVDGLEELPLALEIDDRLLAALDRDASSP
jgi:hypothetical protein